jgi:FimV-like protein
MRLHYILLLALGLLLNSQLMAVELGEIEVFSAVNEPLSARIALSDIEEIDITDLSIAEASLADYARLEVDAQAAAPALSLEVVAGAQGAYLELTTAAAVSSAYLEIVLDTRWPSGRTLTAHTLLLDPPVFLDSNSPGVLSSLSATTQSDAATLSPDAALSNENDTSSMGIQTVTTDRLSTLYSIALAARPDTQVTVQQTMLAIQRLNPRAFADNNINGLYAGVVLRLPSRAEIVELSAAQALNQVRLQNGDEPVAAASSVSVPEAPDATAIVGDQLSVVMQPAAEPSTEPEAALTARISELVSQLAVTQEELARAARERQEFLSRLASIESQIESAQEIIRLKDVQIAELTSALEAASKAAVRPPAAEQKLLWGFVSEAMALAVLGTLAIALLVVGLVYRGRTEDMPDAGFNVISLASGEAAQPAQESPGPNRVQVQREKVIADTSAPSAAPRDSEPAFNPDELEFGAQEAASAAQEPVALEEEEAATKLELAYAYHKMGDDAGAAEILLEVVAEGEGKHQQEARNLLAKIEGLKGSKA